MAILPLGVGSVSVSSRVRHATKKGKQQICASIYTHRNHSARQRGNWGAVVAPFRWGDIAEQELKDSACKRWRIRTDRLQRNRLMPVASARSVYDEHARDEEEYRDVQHPLVNCVLHHAQDLIPPPAKELGQCSATS